MDNVAKEAVKAIVAIANRALEEWKKWEFRAEAAKEICEILVKRYDVSREEYHAIAIDVFTRRGGEEGDED